MDTQQEWAKPRRSANNFAAWKHISQAHLRHRWAQSGFFWWQNTELNSQEPHYDLVIIKKSNKIALHSLSCFQTNLLHLLIAGHFFRLTVLQTAPFLFRTWETYISGILQLFITTFYPTFIITTFYHSIKGITSAIWLNKTKEKAWWNMPC